MDARTSLLYAGDPLYSEYRDESLYPDLNIDQILRAVTEDLDEYRLTELYRRKPLLLSDVEFRQAVAGDLMRDELRLAIERALALISQARRYAQSRDLVDKEDISCKWHLDAAYSYCGAIAALGEAAKLPFKADGWKRLFDWLAGYTGSEEYQNLKNEASRLIASFEESRFLMSIDLGNELLILEDEMDDRDVFMDFFRTFDRFDLGGVRREIHSFPDVRMNSLEANMLSLLLAKHRELFASLRAFRDRFPEFFSENILRFERHAWFYLSYLRHIKKIEGKCLNFSFPEFSDGGALSIQDGFDLSLAQLEKTKSVVKNDLHLDEKERMVLLTGPNQGGKTTFTRMFGQILFFACAGLPIPAASARLPFIDDIRTHFAREETAGSQSGRLQDELLRLRPMLLNVRRNSVLLINELFSSTTAFDACEMGGRLLGNLSEKNCLCLFVTHVYELTYSVPNAVSLVAETEPDENGEPQSTFRIVRREADGAAYAARLLKKYRLTRKEIEVRKGASIPSLES